MLSLEIDDGGAFADLGFELDRLLDVRLDPEAVRRPIVTAIHEANRADRLAGIGADGRPLPHLAASTLAKRQGSPVPFAEHGEDSRSIRNLTVIVGGSPNQVGVRVAWQGAEFFDHHAIGSGRLPVRNIVGIPHSALPEIDRIIADEGDRLVAEAIHGTSAIGGFFSRVFGRRGN